MRERPAAADWKVLESSLERDGCRVISVANQKGGVGKTTTCVNLAAALAGRGHRILVVDLDPQANATTGLGIERGSVDRSTYEVLIGEVTLGAATRRSAVSGLDVAPGSVDLAGAEIELVGAAGRERKLVEALGEAEGAYDYVFVDCPPSLGLLTLNALVAAAEVIVPVQCEYYALEGLGRLLETAERVRRTLNHGLRVTGFVLTMYDARTKLAGQVAEEVRRYFGPLVYNTVIPRSVRLSEAPSFGEPVVTLDPSSRGTIAYRLLAAEVEDRHGGRRTDDRPRDGSGRGSRVDAEVRAVTTSVAGPGGRGYGVISPEPAAIADGFPRRSPWHGES